MSVKVVETTGRESSGDKSSLSQGSLRTLTDRKIRTFRVSGVANDTIAAGTSGIPQVDDPHPDNSDLLCIRVVASGITPTIFDVRCEYEFINVASQSGGLPDPQWTWSSNLLSEQTFFDVDGRQLQTAAGEMLDQPATRVYPTAILHYEFSSLSFGANIIFSHVGRVNDADWTTGVIGTVPAGTALLNGVSATRQVLTGTAYFRVTYDIAFRSQLRHSPKASSPLKELGWSFIYLNAGFMYKRSDGKLVNILDANGVVPRGGPWLLSPDGTDHSLKTPSLEANFLYVPMFHSAGFGALNIP